jgi:plasmid stability protein
MNVTIKNIPDDVHKTLKQEAAQRGRSLNTQILQTLSSEAAEIARRRKMRESRASLERFVASLPKMSSSVPLIRADRRQH